MNNDNSTTTLLRRSALVLAIATAGSAWGQEERPATSSRTLEEIVVTAEHRASTLQDTEISMSAFSSASIEEMGIESIADIGKYTPNLTISPFIGKSGFAVNIRGVRNGETLITFEPAVGLYIDGVLIAKNAGALLDVVDAERIEVLRGPQGTLYGRNTIGGAINLITKKPTDEFGGKVSVTLGSEDQRDITGVLNLPLLDRSSPVGALNLRASVASLNRDGLYDNDFPNAPQDELETRDRDIALIHLQWEPTDDLAVRYSLDRTRHDEVPSPPFTTVARPFAIGGLVGPYVEEQGDRPSSGSFDGQFVSDTEVDGHALNVTWDVTDALTFTSITSYRELESTGLGDADGSPLSLLHTEDIQSSETLTQEFRFVGTAMDARLDYAVGAFYMDEKGDVLNVTEVFGNRLGSTARLENEIWALYGQTTYHLTPRWHLTGGIRYTEEDRWMTKADVANPALEFPEANETFENISPMVSLGYDWSDDVRMYGKISRGYQSGGFNSRDATPELFAIGFEEETLTAYELGLKSTLAGGRYRFNAATYFSDYDDKQVNQFLPGNPPRSVIRNAGVVEIYGAELEFLARLTDHLEVGADYGYTHPEFEEYNSGLGEDLTDSNFPYTPEHNAHAFVSYTFPRVDYGLLSARLDWNYQDERTFLVPAPEANSGDSYDLWNARITLDEIAGPGDTTARVSLWGKNLLDEEYWNFGVDLTGSLGYAINNYGPQRTYGLDLELRF